MNQINKQNIFARREGFIQGARKNKLFIQSWEQPNATGSIIINHGQGEHSDCYHRLINYFENDRWNFYAWDLPGHGRSEGKRGYAENFNDYVVDYSLFLSEIMNQPKVKSGPTVLLSHSLGGEVQLKALIENSELQPTAQVYSAPLLGLSIPVPMIKRQGSVWLNKILPTMTLWNEIRYNMLTRDPQVIHEFEADVLRHDRISAAVFLGMLENFKFIEQGVSEISGPVLFQCPESDPVVSTPVAKELFSKLGSTDKMILTYGDGARHEMYNDIHRLEVFSDLKKFLDRFAK